MVMWNSYHRYGYANFKGGSQSITKALARVIKENGGKVRLGTLATKIVVDGGKATRVETEDDTCYRAKYVVSNASAPATIHKLIGADKVAKEDVAKYQTWKVGHSAFVVYLGVNRDYSKEMGKAHEIMVAESEDAHENFRTIDACDIARSPWAIANMTMMDPATAPKGKNVIVLITQLSYDCGGKWKWDIGFDAYKAYKDKIATALLRRAEKYLPDLGKHIEVAEVATPVTLSRFTLNPRGTIFGWDNIIKQSMLHRMDATRLQGIDNLFMAGAWSFPGGGQSAVLMSGANAAREIIKKLK